MKKPDKALDIVLRSILFGFCALIYITTFVQVKFNKGFLYVIGGLACFCSVLYLLDGILLYAFNIKIPVLHKLINGEDVEEEAPPLKKAFVLIGALILDVLGCYLIGVFCTVFVFMSLFPFLYERRSIIISVIVAALTCGLFYYVFVYSIGLKPPEGILFGF